LLQALQLQFPSVSASSSCSQLAFQAPASKSRASKLSVPFSSSFELRFKLFQFPSSFLPSSFSSPFKLRLHSLPSSLGLLPSSASSFLAPSSASKLPLQVPQSSVFKLSASSFRFKLRFKLGSQASLPSLASKAPLPSSFQFPSSVRFKFPSAFLQARVSKALCVSKLGSQLPFESPRSVFLLPVSFQFPSSVLPSSGSKLPFQVASNSVQSPFELRLQALPSVSFRSSPSSFLQASWSSFLQSLQLGSSSLAKSLPVSFKPPSVPFSSLQSPFQVSFKLRFSSLLLRLFEAPFKLPLSSLPSSARVLPLPSSASKFLASFLAKPLPKLL